MVLYGREELERRAVHNLDLADEKDSHNQWKWEHPWELHYNLKDGDVYVEAGAFWGRYAREALPKVGKSGKIILIEPSPINFRTLELWVERDGLENVILVNKAVSDEQCTFPFVCWGNPAGHRFAQSNDITHEEYGEYIVDVEVDILDNIFSDLELDYVDLLSCDVENAEVPMVKGCKEFFSKHRIRNVALGAYHANHLPVTNADLIIPILRAWGYKDLVYEQGVVYGHI